jgi:lipopolysaccharide/colanic/teichoic acid biosynthesis glycosyltransferase
MLIKRIFDIVASIAGLAILAPLLIIISICILVVMGRPLIFTQRRPGYNEKPFLLYKFRTMTKKTDLKGQPLPDEQRLTSLGQFLRRTSIDEIPELINVLKGEMSIVGPRPLLMEYLPHYSQHQRLRHSIRPGITGHSQINGRNNVSWEEKFELDIWYVKNMSFFLDLTIIYNTISVVVKGKGVSAPGHVTMPRFDETKENKE